MSLKVDISSKLDKFKMDIRFETKSNRIGILGESGAGKSMLLKYLAGIYSPDSGQIQLEDAMLFDAENGFNVIPQDRNIAYMFQNYALFPTMSVRENIEIVVKGDKLCKKEKADYLLQQFQIENLADKKPAELSGGQQQRVALARVLAYEPKLILLDEPFSALDENLKESLQIELEQMITDYNGMVIMVSHSRDELYKFSDEIIIVSDGKVVETGLTERIFTKPKTVKAARLLGVNNILPVRSTADGLLEIPDWGICLPLDSKDLDGLRYIGIRDRDLKPVWDNDFAIGYQKDLVFDISVLSSYESLHEKKVFFTVERGGNSSSPEKQNRKYSFLFYKDDSKNISEGKLPTKLSIDKEKIILFR